MTLYTEDGYTKLDALREHGYTVLDRYDQRADPQEWLDVEFVDWKSSGAFRFAPLASAYGEYVGTYGGYLGGDSRGGAAADLDSRVAIANCQDGNYAAGIPVLQQKLRDARVDVPPPPAS